MNKEQLLARAQELQIEVPEGATNKQIDDLIKIAEHPALAKAVKQLDDDIKEHAGVVDALNAVISELNEELEAFKQEDKPAAHATYKSGKDKYAFAIKQFRFKGEKYDTAEAVKDKDLMEQIIASKFIHLKKL